MRLPAFIKICLSASLVLCTFSACAQQDEADSTLYKNSVQHAISLYHQFMNEESSLYNGSQYVSYAQTIQEGIPFFQSPVFNKGSVIYNEVLYENVPLLYDVLKGELITIIPASNYNIRLVSDKISNFSLLDHHFIRLIKDSTDKIIKTGFYDVLYAGNISVYKRQTKTIGEDLSSGKLRTFIIESNSFYIKKNNSFFTISSKKDALAVLKDKKKEIQDYIRRNKLNTHKDKEHSLPLIAAYYDELTKH